MQESGREGQEICHRKTQENIWLSGQPSGTGQVLWHRLQASSGGGWVGLGGCGDQGEGGGGGGSGRLPSAAVPRRTQAGRFGSSLLVRTSHTEEES